MFSEWPETDRDDFQGSDQRRGDVRLRRQPYSPVKECRTKGRDETQNRKQID